MRDEICKTCGRWIDPEHNTCGCSEMPDLEALQDEPVEVAETHEHVWADLPGFSNIKWCIYCPENLYL